MVLTMGGCEHVVLWWGCHGDQGSRSRRRGWRCKRVCISNLHCPSPNWVNLFSSRCRLLFSHASQNNRSLLNLLPNNLPQHSVFSLDSITMSVLSVPEAMPCMGCIRHFSKSFPENAETLDGFGCEFNAAGTSRCDHCCTRKGSCETVRFSEDLFSGMFC
jgi:hypothetical protein